MIAYIEGSLIQTGSDHVVLETAGLGYHIFVTTTCLQKCRIGAKVQLHTHFALKEDAAQLFGFINTDELKLFKMILNVSGIGPKGAMAALSSMGVEQFAAAVVSEDIKAITKIPGVGKKTAQRLVIELKDKLSEQRGVGTVMAPTGGTGSNAPAAEALAALEALGYSGSEIMPALNKVMGNAGEEISVEQIIKTVLKHLAAF